MLQTLERTNIFDARVLTAAHADALRALAGPGGLPLLPCLHPALEEGQIVGDYAGQDELQAAAALLPLYAEDPRVIDVTGFDTSDAQHGELTLGIRAVDEDKDMTIVGRKDNIDFLRENFGQVSSIRWTREFRAPINVGDVMGILTFYSENKGVAEYELVATRSIAARADAPLTLEQIEAYTAQDESPWPRFSWDLLVPPGLILLALIWLIRFIRRHRKKRIKAPKIKPIKKKYLR
mgnify:CR=1 FL=1